MMKRIYQNKYICLFFFILLTLWYGFVILYKEIDKSCDGWEDGLNGKLENTGDYCVIDRPYVCWPNLLNNVFRLSPEPCDKISEGAIKSNKIKVLEAYGFIDTKIYTTKI